MKVRCSNRQCRKWSPKEECVPFGLGWCCDEACRWQAIQDRQRRVARQAEKITQRGYSIPPPPRSNPRNGPTPAKRRYVMQRDGKRCRMCGDATKNRLHVHHIRYRSEYQDDPHNERNLLTLCLVCHDRIHSNKKHWQPVLLELIRLHYEEDLFLMVLDVEKRMAAA